MSFPTWVEPILGPDHAGQFPGPAFGIPGTRRLAGVHDRPVIGTIIKPSIGLTPAQTADLVDSLCAAGIDFIKDDELIADPPDAPFDERLRAVMPVLQRHADRLGRMPMYAINISGSVDEMLRRHDAVLAAGGPVTARHHRARQPDLAHRGARCRTGELADLGRSGAVGNDHLVADRNLTSLGKDASSTGVAPKVAPRLPALALAVVLRRAGACCVFSSDCWMTVPQVQRDHGCPASRRSSHGRLQGPPGRHRPSRGHLPRA
ncbi:RuBisCO large subunit C-terminal-like domain-containing protein [Leptothrix discophora]|uniref:RuBisCO large subunit C-terminal-like domain-containing protein n=1 Tax=Leptothrix discophora TaxID=89 RepID=UPI00387E39CD